MLARTVLTEWVNPFRRPGKQFGKNELRAADAVVFRREEQLPAVLILFAPGFALSVLEMNFVIGGAARFGGCRYIQIDTLER